MITFPGIKSSKGEAHNSSAAVAEVQNDWTFTSNLECTFMIGCLAIGATTVFFLWFNENNVEKGQNCVYR